jgi:hypothetical protein
MLEVVSLDTFSNVIWGVDELSENGWKKDGERAKCDIAAEEHELRGGQYACLFTVCSVKE